MLLSPWEFPFPNAFYVFFDGILAWLLSYMVNAHCDDLAHSGFYNDFPSPIHQEDIGNFP